MPTMAVPGNGESGFLPESEHEKMLPHPTKTTGAQITKSPHGMPLVITLYANCMVKNRFIISVYRMDGWMPCDFTSFLTVIQSYQDDVWMIMKGCVQWNSIYG